MIPNFLSQLTELTPAVDYSNKNPDEISVIQRIYKNILAANSYWYYVYGGLTLPLLIVLLLTVKEDLTRKGLVAYHQEYNSLTGEKNILNSDINELDSFINKFSDLASDSIHYHILENRIFETKRPSIYFVDIKLNPKESYLVLKSSSFLDGAIFLRDIKDYEGVSLPLYSPESWKKDSDGFSSSSNSEFEMKINFSVNKSSIDEIYDAYKALSNDQMTYKLKLLVQK